MTFPQSIGCIYGTIDSSEPLTLIIEYEVFAVNSVRFFDFNRLENCSKVLWFKDKDTKIWKSIYWDGFFQNRTFLFCIYQDLQKPNFSFSPKILDQQKWSNRFWNNSTLQKISRCEEVILFLWYSLHITDCVLQPSRLVSSSNVFFSRKSEMPSVYDCPVCFCEYTIDGNQTPCVLPCGHSVCLECSFKLCGQSRSGRKASKCPFCRQNLPLQRSSSFSINYALLSVLEHQQRAEAAKESSRRRCSEIHVTFDDNPPEEMYSSNHPSSAKRPSAQSDSIIEYSSRTACRCKPGNEREAYQRASVKPIKASHEIQKSRDQLPPIPPHEPLDERFIQAGESIPSQRQKLRRTHDSWIKRSFAREGTVMPIFGELWA